MENNILSVNQSMVDYFIETIQNNLKQGIYKNDMFEMGRSAGYLNALSGLHLIDEKIYNDLWNKVWNQYSDKEV